MPDIDSDLAKGVREKTIEYVRHKYGEKAVCLIMTKAVKAPKGAVKDASRFYGQKMYGEKLTALGDKLSKNIPSRVNLSFDSPYDENDEGKENYQSVYEVLREKYADNKDALEVLRWAKCIEGMFTHMESMLPVLLFLIIMMCQIMYRLSTTLRQNRWTASLTWFRLRRTDFLKWTFLGSKH